jgi:uncharacterized membrane protein YidH (DUF202 family)
VTGRRPLHSRPGREIPDRPGVPAERTEMAWERSAIGLFATAVLLMFRHVAPMTAARAALLSAYLLLGLLTVHLGLRRGRQIREIHAGRGRGSPVPAARGSVLLLGWSVVGIAAATTVVIVAQA